MSGRFLAVPVLVAVVAIASADVAIDLASVAVAAVSSLAARPDDPLPDPCQEEEAGQG